MIRSHHADERMLTLHQHLVADATGHETMTATSTSVLTTPPLTPGGIPQVGLPPEPVVSLTVDQYHAMIAAGILESGAPLELLEGWLVTRMTKNPRHSAATALLRRHLEPLVPPGWSVDSQEPITTIDSEPEPDVAIIRGARENYVDRHPGPADVALVVEVADSTLDRDRNWKRRIYARAEIANYWIVNLTDRQVERYSQPVGDSSSPDYARRDIYSNGQSVPLVIDGIQVGLIAVDSLLPS